MLDGISFQKNVLAINNVFLYRGFTVINFNNFSILVLLLHLAQYSVDKQKSQMLRL
jgi:hypothetical protein